MEGPEQMSLENAELVNWLDVELKKPLDEKSDCENLDSAEGNVVDGFGVPMEVDENGFGNLHGTLGPGWKVR